MSLLKSLNEQREIESFIEKWSGDDSIENFKLYILSFNILCNISKTEYIPVELTVTRYSIKLGIEDSFHSFINPGVVPKGYMGISKDISDFTHKIPIVGFTLANKDYAEIYQSMMKFISSKEGPVLFCNEKEIEQNKSCLEWLYNKSKSSDTHSVRIYDVTLLLMKLSECGHHPFPSFDMAAESFNCHSFDYIPNSRCDFHEKIDNNFCTLGRTKRLCFILSSVLCKLFKIRPIEQHVPPKKTNYQAEQLNCSSLPTFSSFLKENSFQSDDPIKIRDDNKPSHQKSNAVHQPNNLENPERLSQKDQEILQRKSFTNQIAAVGSTTARGKGGVYNSESRVNRQPFSMPKVLIDDPHYNPRHKVPKPVIFRQPHSLPMVLRAEFENVDFSSEGEKNNRKN